MSSPSAILTPTWTGPQRIGFRFAFVFFALYILPFPFTSLPFLAQITAINKNLTGWYNWIFGLYGSIWDNIVPWIGKHILGLEKPITIVQSGSGDKMFDYVFLFTVVSVAAISTIIWSVLDRQRAEYNRLYHWLRVLVRYYLASMMILYGVVKVFHLQMPYPSLSQLSQAFGDRSPMGLAWSYVGYSAAFSMFTGFSEVLGGFLLFFRRTTTLGAVIVAAVMTNVVVMNFTFDIPVKLFSSLLVLMALFLIIPDIKRLLNVLYFNKPTSPRPMPQYFGKGWPRITANTLKSLFIVSVLFANIATSIVRQYQYGDKRPKPPLYGLYIAETVVINSDTIPPLTTDTTRWHHLIVERENYAQVKLMNDSIRRYSFVVDTTNKQVTLYQGVDSLNKSTLSYEIIENQLMLSGKFKADSVYLRFREKSINDFRLMNRKFRWVQEYPYNR